MRTRSAKKRLAELRVETNACEDALKADSEFIGIFRGLQTSCRERDPGKYREALFLLSPDGRRVVVRELLSSPESYIARVEGYAVFQLRDVLIGRCDEGHERQPVVERYLQTYDSPHGDEWLKERLVVCLECHRVTTIWSKCLSNRF